jgi:hypothetical protein
MLLKLTCLLVALASVVETEARELIHPRKLAKASKQSKSATKSGKEPEDPDPEDPGNDDAAENGPPSTTYAYKFGGWVGDDDWGVQIPFANLDFLNYGYLTCIQTLQNGPCGSPGIRAASDGPPGGTNGAECVKFTIGGASCSTSGWNPNTVVSAVTQYGWCGVDVDNECSMTAIQMNAQFQAANNAGVTSMFSVLGPSQLQGLTISGPQYYATLTFWGAEWCSASNPAPGCVEYNPGGYEQQLPAFIQGVLGYGVPSRNLLLGLHSQGIDSSTIQFWCDQIISNNLGGVMISFITTMDTTLFQELQTCLGSTPPGPTPGCNVYAVQSGDTCWQIAENKCQDGNDWSTELFQDSSCTTPMNTASCSSLQIGQNVYSSCNAPAPTNCKAYTVKSGDTCWQVGEDQCGDGNDWSTELFQDSSCTTPMDTASCGALQTGEEIYTNCN